MRFPAFLRISALVLAINSHILQAQVSAKLSAEDANLIAHLALAQTKPDAVLLNGKIFTSVAARPYVQALAIRGDRIIATGDTKSIETMAGPDTRRIDLHNQTVIPGINDAHHHFEFYPTNQVMVRTKSMDPAWSEASGALAVSASKAAPHSLLVLGIGDAIFEDPSIDRNILDQVAQDNPVELITFPGHAAVLNTAAIKLFGVTENQPDPAGGRFERDAKGRLNGTVREYALVNIDRVLADAVPDRVAQTEASRGLARAAKFGITSIQELSIEASPTRMVALLSAVPNQLRVRIVSMPGTTVSGRETAEVTGVLAHPANLITVSGEKWMVDGVPVEGTFTPRGALKFPTTPPLDSIERNLPLTFGQDEITAMLKESLRNDDRILFHVSGYLGAKAILDGMDATGGKAVWSKRRVRFEHGDGIFPDLLNRIKNYGVIVVQNPTHLMAFAQPGGMPAFTSAQPLKSLLSAGIPVALGSDGEINPYLNIMLATIHGDRPTEAITREQAVIAYTLGSAYAEFQEKEKGTLEQGKLADLAVLSQDIFTVPTEELPKTQSVLTFVGGKVVYEAKDSAAASQPQSDVAHSAVACTAVTPDGHDGVLVAPENHHVLFENDDVRVIEVTQAPHSKETMHTHARPSIFYLDGPTATRYVVAGDEAHAVERKAPPVGMKPLVIPMKPEGLHSVENLGDNTFHALRVELKHPGCDLVAKPTGAPGPDDAVVVAPVNYRLLFENADVRVIDVVIAAHAREPMHTHPWGGFVYFVHASRLETVDAKGRSEGVKTVPSGLKIVPVEARGLHATANLADEPLHEVRFELKRETGK